MRFSDHIGAVALSLIVFFAACNPTSSALAGSLGNDTCRMATIITEKGDTLNVPVVFYLGQIAPLRFRLKNGGSVEIDFDDIKSITVPTPLPSDTLKLRVQAVSGTVYDVVDDGNPHPWIGFPLPASITPTKLESMFNRHGILPPVFRETGGKTYARLFLARLRSITFEAKH